MKFQNNTPLSKTDLTSNTELASVAVSKQSNRALNFSGFTIFNSSDDI